MKKRKRKKIKRDYSIINKISIAIFAFLILTIHLPLGGQRQWIWSFSLILTFVILGLTSINFFLKKEIQIQKSFLFLIFSAIIAFSILQCTSLLIPFSDTNLSIWQNLSSEFAITANQTSSLAPFRTQQSIFQLLLGTICFYLSLQLFQTKKAYVTLLMTILIGIALNAFFGYYNQFDISSTKLFNHLPPQGYSISGTFMNRNHFSTLIEMGCCSALGLLCATIFAKKFENKLFYLATSSILFSFLVVSGLFSFSRTGISLIISLLALFAGFIVYEFKKRKKLKYSIYLFLSGGLIAVFAGFRGLSYIWDRYETTFNPNSPSLNSRFEFWKTTWVMIQEYWATGVGLGGYGYAQTKFENGVIPNKIAFHAHNEWIELIAELGGPMGITVICLFIILFTIALIKILKLRKSQEKWIGLGIAFSILSVLLHEIVGFALRSPGVLVILFILIGLFAKYARGEKYFKIRLNNFSRIPFLIFSLTILSYSTIYIYPYLKTGFDYEDLKDRNRAGKPFYTNMNRQENAEYQLGLVNQINQEFPKNGSIIKAKCFANLAKDLFIKEKLNFVSKKVGREIEEKELNKYNKFVFNYDNLSLDIKNEMTEYYSQSIDNIKESLKIYPNRSYLFLLLGEYTEKLGFLEKNLNEDKLSTIFAKAHYYSPNMAPVTKSVAYAKSRQITRKIKREGQNLSLDDKDVVLFMNYINSYAKQAPTNSYKMLNLLWQHTHSVKLVKDVLPEYLPAHLNFFELLFKQRLFKECDLALNKIEELNKFNIIENDEEFLAKADKLNEYDRVRRFAKTKILIQDFIDAKRVVLTGLRANWKDYKNKVAEYRNSRHKIMADDLTELQKKYDNKEYHRVYSSIKNLIRKEPNHPEYLLLLANSAINLGYDQEYEYNIMNLLFSRLNKFDKKFYDEISSSLNAAPKRIGNRDKKKFPKQDFFKLSAEFYMTEISKVKSETLLNKLNKIVDDLENKMYSWRNSHLLYYLIGQIYESQNNNEKALKFYNEALSICPNSIQVAEAANKLLENKIKIEKPEIITNIQFGQNINLYGYSVSPNKILHEENIEVTFFWEATGNISRDRIIGCNYYNETGWGFNDSHQAGSKEDANHMVSWRMGELIKVKRTISPYRKSMQQKNILPDFGYYDMRLYLYSSGIKANRLTSLVECLLPVFEIVESKDDEIIIFIEE